MKRILILLCLPLLFNSCGKNGISPNNTGNNHSIVGKKWVGNVPNFGDLIFELNSDGNLYTYDYNECVGYLQNQLLGAWVITDQTIKYVYVENSVEYTEIFGNMADYSDVEIKFVINGSTNSICSIHIPTSLNLNCTYIPDDNFEQMLINLGYDIAPLDNWVYTSMINTVTSLYVDGLNIADLIGIEDFTALTYLNCYGNQLTSLDVSQNTALDTLYCYNNQLTTLDVSGATALTYLYCGNNQLTTLDVSQNTALDTLYCFSNQLTTLDVSANTALTTLYCGNNQLTTLDVSANTALTDLNCYSNQLTTLDVSANTALTNLNCRDSQLTTLDVRNGNNGNFNNLYAENNPNLFCIDVDDAAWSTANWTNIDTQHYFSEQCP